MQRNEIQCLRNRKNSHKSTVRTLQHKQTTPSQPVYPTMPPNGCWDLSYSMNHLSVRTYWLYTPRVLTTPQEAHGRKVARYAVLGWDLSWNRNALSSTCNRKSELKTRVSDETNQQHGLTLIHCRQRQATVRCCRNRSWASHRHSKSWVGSNRRDRNTWWPCTESWQKICQHNTLPNSQGLKGGRGQENESTLTDIFIIVPPFFNIRTELEMERGEVEHKRRFLVHNAQATNQALELLYQKITF